MKTRSRPSGVDARVDRAPEVEREGKVRRAKLFYLRGRKGKEALFVKERVSATVAKKAKSAAKRAAAAEKAAA